MSAVKKFKIAIISKSDRGGGGGGRCAEDLVNQLRGHFHQADHFTRHSMYTETIPLYTNFEKKIYHRLIDVGFQEIIPFEKKILKQHDKQNSYDIFHFHDISTAVSPLTLKWLSDNHKKVIWTLHDCSSVTGGCIHTLDCQSYFKNCYSCPQINQTPLGRNFDFSFLYKKLKKYVHKNSNIYYVSPSKWLADFVYDSGLLKTYPTIISNGVDTNVFKAHNKYSLRSRLKLPNNRFIVLLSSAWKNNHFKGLDYAVEVLNQISHINPFLLIIGQKDKELLSRLEKFDYFATDYISERIELNKYYAAADIFLNTTIAEVQSIASLEAMASGTPVLGFHTGGLPEMITQNVDGFLVKDKNIQLLADKILDLYKTKEYITMGIKAREKIETSFCMEIFYEKYINLYSQILKETQC
jgi:glycosyltransferase involved in cell wall biosynthesis